MSRVTIQKGKDGSGTVERKVVNQSLGIELRLLKNYGLEEGDQVILTQRPDGSGSWRKVP